MNLLEKSDKYAVYEFGYPDKMDGQMKLSIDNPLDYEILQPSAMGEGETLRAFATLAKLIRNGEIPEKACRAS